jgi:threonine synthase
LLANGTVDKDARVACVLTGHLLKDPDATVNYHSKMGREFSNPPIKTENDLEKIIALMK